MSLLNRGMDREVLVWQHQAQRSPEQDASEGSGADGEQPRSLEATPPSRISSVEMDGSADGSDEAERPDSSEPDLFVEKPSRPGESEVRDPLDPRPLMFPDLHDYPCG